MKALLLFLALCAPLWAAAATESGLKVGDAVLPFTSNVVTGPYRGMQHCFVCDTGVDQPGLVVFCRKRDAATGRFIAAFRKDILGASDAPMAWFVFLGPSGSVEEANLEVGVDEFATIHGLTQLNVTALGDPTGPPGYLIDEHAALTAVVYRRFAVRFQKAFPLEGWTDAAAEQAAADVHELVKKVRGAEFATGGAKVMPGPVRNPTNQGPATPPAPFVKDAAESGAETGPAQPPPSYPGSNTNVDPIPKPSPKGK